MKAILGPINGEYLRDLTLSAADGTEVVYAAVAYASKKSLLFDWCRKHGVPLKYWGRYDHTVPVSVAILRSFLSARSPNYQCKLATKFHPKVIWWRGHGCYIGSANLTDSAWNTNVEAGIFYTEDDLDDRGFTPQLIQFFRTIDENSFDLTTELVDKIEARKKELSRRDFEDREAQKHFMSLTGVKQWSGLVTVQKASSLDASRTRFLDEWNSTLEIMRMIGERVGRESNRPPWVRADVPDSLVADQFLHAYYYHHTFDGRKANYEAFFEDHRTDPEAALTEAVDWWANTPTPPSNENNTLDRDAPRVRELMQRDRLKRIGVEEWKDVCSRVHSIKDYARRVSNTAVGLPDRPHYSIPEKADALAKFHVRQRNASDQTIFELLDYVLYGGDDMDTPVRIWEADSNPRYKIERFGLSALGEVVGWARPEVFPPRNRRTSKALRSLGFDVSVH